jgi:hypothetical protein
MRTFEDRIRLLVLLKLELSDLALMVPLLITCIFYLWYTACNQRKLVDFYWFWRRVRVGWDGRATRPGPWPDLPTRPIYIRSYNLTSLAEPRAG